MKRWIKWFYEVLPFKKEFFLILRRLPVPQAIYRHLHFKGIFSIAAGNCAFKIIHYGYELENEVFWKGLEGWEKTTLEVWSALSRKSNCIIDVGANTGLFSLLSKAVNERATVIAFEPVNRVAEKLEKNIRLNQFDITAVKKGVSNFNGTAVIYDIPFEHVYSVTINKNLNALDQKVTPTEIQVITLSSYAEIHQLKKLDLVKIDVETHEAEVLEGMIEILRKDKPALIIEILDNEVADKVNRLLSPFHYLFFILDDENGPQRTLSIKKNTFKNFLVCSQIDADYLIESSVITV